MRNGENRLWRTFLACSLTVSLASCASSEVRQGDRLAERGEWDQAVAVYREALKKEPFSEKVQERLDHAKAQAAQRHFVEGRKLLGDNRLPEALRELKQAVGFDPTKPEHQAGMAEALRLKEARDQLQAGDKFMGLGRLEEALAAYERSIELDPKLKQALDGITEITKQQRAAKAIGTSTQPVALRFQNAKLKEVFEILARTAGVNVIFDKEVRDDAVTIFIKDLPFDEALNLILNTNSLVAQRVAPDTILVMPNNKQKQAQYQDLLMRTFYLANTKAKEAVNLVRTMLDSKKIYVDEKVNAIVVREEPAKLQLAERLLFAIDRREPEVELDLEVLEINRTKNLKYGFNFAKQVGSGLIPPGATGGAITTATTQFTYRQLTSLGPDSYIFTMPASVLVDFFKQESDAKTLASPKLRVLNNKSATINIGDKQPILLSTTNVLPGQAATGAVPTTSTVTSIEFKDVGVKLTVEPSINLNDEVILKIKVEVTRLGDQVTLQASPEIKQFRFGTRLAETTLMLKDDETVVLGGLIQDEDRKNRNTVPLLGDIPLIGHLFTSTTEDRISTEVVLTITPRVVKSLTTPPIASQAFWSGTENTYATTQLFAPRALKVSQDTAGAKEPTKAGTAKAPVESPIGNATPAPASGNAAASQTASAALQAPKTLNTVGSPPVPNMNAMPTSPQPPVQPALPQPAPASTGSPAGASSPMIIGNNPAPSEAPQQVARGPALLKWRPLEASAALNQEFRLDIVAQEGLQAGDLMTTVSFDPKGIEFRRVGPGTAAISARASDGQVIMTIKKQGASGSGEAALVSLFFYPKVGGDQMLTMQTVAGGDAAAGAGSAERALVHVK